MRAGGQTGAAGRGESTRREENTRGPSGGKENSTRKKGSVSGMSVAFWQRPTGRKLFPLPQPGPSLENSPASVRDPREALFCGIQVMILDHRIRSPGSGDMQG